MAGLDSPLCLDVGDRRLLLLLLGGKFPSLKPRQLKYTADGATCDKHDTGHRERVIVVER